MVVAFLLKHLGGNVIWSPDGGIEEFSLSLRFSFEFLVFGGKRVIHLMLGTKPEIREFDVSFSVYQDIVGLDVSVYVVHFVNALDSEDQFGHEEFGLILWKNVFLDEEIHHVSPGKILHHEIEVVFVFEAGVQLGDPLRRGFTKKTLFGVQVLDLVLENHVRFLHLFHRHILVGLSPAETNFAESPAADDFDREKVPG